MRNKNEIKEKFERDGFVVFSPNDLLETDVLRKLQVKANEILPNFSEGKVDPSTNNSHFDPRFKIGYDFSESIMLYGCALRHRATRGRGSIENIKDDNFLYGKRAVTRFEHIAKDVSFVMEHEEILECVKSILGTGEISLHQAGLARSFPFSTGESNRYHMDTYGFTKGNNQILPDDKFLVNAMIYISDVDEKTCPLRVIPGSHRKYREINRCIANSLGVDDSINRESRDVLYSEILPANLEKPVDVIGHAGTVIFFHGNLLHCATENKDDNRHRDALILNFSKHSDREFGKEYLENIAYKEKIKPHFKNESLVSHIGVKVNRSNFLIYEKKIKQGLKYILKKASKFKDKTFVNSSSIEGKNYLNIGCGLNFQDDNVIGLDFDPNPESRISYGSKDFTVKKACDVVFDLNTSDQLPFDDDSLSGVYSSHCFEHLVEKQCLKWFKESSRILKKGGVLRITVPNILEYLENYEKKNISYFNWVRKKRIYPHESWLRMIVRAFAEPVVDNFTDEELYDIYSKHDHTGFLDFFSDHVSKVSDSRYLNPQAHKSWWSPEKMIKTLEELNFAEVYKSTPGSSKCKYFTGKSKSQFIYDGTRPHMSLFVEAIK